MFPFHSNSLVPFCFKHRRNCEREGTMDIPQASSKSKDEVKYRWRKSTFNNSYSHINFPINGPQWWPLDGQVPINPPMLTRSIGRPKKMRNKVNDDSRNPHVLPRKLTIVIYNKYSTM
ncbi:unnamed protein product [Lathyrus oleraceus]|uniref:Uncharacterized protein n=1 Tax=Pisum sativum TaxID=3888 RepID=A0A9D4WIZ1_PEA|nr:hypothetical protein KIW84_050197 [Pisum sativum]